MKEHAFSHPRLVIAAGDEVEQYVLPEQPVHVEHESEDKGGRKRKQHILPLNAPLTRRRECPSPSARANKMTIR